MRKKTDRRSDGGRGGMRKRAQAKVGGNRRGGATGDEGESEQRVARWPETEGREEALLNEPSRAQRGHSGVTGREDSSADR